MKAKAEAMRELSVSAGYWLVCCAWLLTIGPLSGIEGGCGNREAHKCCPGRNNDCLDFSRRRTPCYCDTYCEKTGDCCEDYHAVCQASAVDCVIGPWGPWSECSSLCGTGSKDRMRQVIVPPRNGGTPCPDLKQRRGCLGDGPLCDTAKEVAKILPNYFKRDFKDPWRRPHMLKREKLPSYCIYFRLKQVGAACHLSFWSSQLARERHVCVECQGDAVGSKKRCQGDGLQGARTFWTAASVAGCQGSWMQESSQENCVCPRHSFIFV
ncbi:somatomedin-B and thrombospondin type-1 domain-containing protein-like isoform X2 [Sphaerodactylus townsendi]|uniref:somatomedin-B and thrombospondin type-1 domain-containing protein-like isoform X2 n=1 Tax=Sphaerodactylus townsendi TaxID=933632 RepID=UPI0020269879|nr:somatomedin-B and thrombospondin type-1 domain-containing protein-like isoform X2 [Sphaerodactylus townsendi]